MSCQTGAWSLKRGTYMLQFLSVMVTTDFADKTEGMITMRTCLTADCADNTIIDDYKIVNDEVDYAKLSYTSVKDPKITV
jgi:hypothetical protein